MMMGSGAGVSPRPQSQPQLRGELVMNSCRSKDTMSEKMRQDLGLPVARVCVLGASKNLFLVPSHRSQKDSLFICSV